MKQTLLASTVAATAMFLSACGDTSDEVRPSYDTPPAPEIPEVAAPTGTTGNAYVDALIEIAGAMEKVTDQASADAAAATLARGSERLEAMGGAQAIELTEEEVADIVRGRNPKVIETQASITASLMRIQQNNPELMPQLMAGMERLKKAREGVGSN